ncbi:MAG: hypothetical protein KBF58_02240 [Methyloversatilis sp.]|nr:hypothetical protein [Methyloversatilis sp.]MBP6193033.1 hypothetical protein [Methyloversatilis sp.]MBP9116878.1 hypothetical protein [Methyloversatilis sp.]
MKVVQSILLVLLAGSFAACDKLPIPDPNRAAMQKEQDGKAVGAACRHAGRAIEDCYKLNPKASKSAVFAGWREMNDYMTENKLEVVLPTLPTHNKKVSVSENPPAEAHPETEHSGRTKGEATDASPASAGSKGEKNPALTAG